MIMMTKGYLNEEITEFQKHITLYSKGWYKTSGDQIKDVSKIICVIAGIEETDKGNVYEHICRTFFNLCKHYITYRRMIDIFK